MKFKVDLMKRRVNLLSRARSSIENVEGIDFVFADVNYRLNVKFRDERVKAFNIETELANIIAGLLPIEQSLFFSLSQLKCAQFDLVIPCQLIMFLCYLQHEKDKII